LYLPLGLGLPLPGIDYTDAKRTQGPAKLDFPLILSNSVSYMNPLMQNKPKDGMVIQIVDQRNPIRGDSLPHGLKMFKGGLSFYEPGPHPPPGVAIFGEDEIVFGCSTTTAPSVDEDGSFGVPTVPSPPSWRCGGH